MGYTVWLDKDSSADDNILCRYEEVLKCVRTFSDDELRIGKVRNLD